MCFPQQIVPGSCDRVSCDGSWPWIISVGPRVVTKVFETERQQKSQGGRDSSGGRGLSDDAITGLKMEERGQQPRNAGGLQKLPSERNRKEFVVSGRKVALQYLDFKLREVHG